MSRDISLYIKEPAPVHVLYTSGENGIDNFLHSLVLHAVGANRHVISDRTYKESEIRHLWTKKHYDCIFLVMNNILMTRSSNIEGRLECASVLIQWLRERSSATIIALSGYLLPGIEDSALRSGANRFFPLPINTVEMMDFLKRRLEPTDP